MPNPFFIKDAKYILLTYPQIPENVQDHFPWGIVNACSTKGAECLVARERHQDGGIHFHAFVDWGGRRYSSRDTRGFDVSGHHPNITKVGKTPRKAWDYVTKDGDIVAGGAQMPTEEATSSENIWEYIISAESRDDFYSRMRERAQRYLICSYPSIAKYADWRYQDSPEPYRNPEGWTFQLQAYPSLPEWVRDNLVEKPGM